MYRKNTIKHQGYDECEGKQRPKGQVECLNGEKSAYNVVAVVIVVVDTECSVDTCHVQSTLHAMYSSDVYCPPA